MRSSHAIVLASPVRTAIGTFGGALKDVPATDLGAAAIKATVERAGLKPEDVATVVMGNVVQAGNKMNPARQAAVHAGLPMTVPAMTVNSRAIVTPGGAVFASNGNVAIRPTHFSKQPAVRVRTWRTAGLPTKAMAPAATRSFCRPVEALLGREPINARPDWAAMRRHDELLAIILRTRRRSRS